MHDPRDVLVGDGGDRPYGGTTSRPADRREDAQHDGRPAPSAGPRARERRAHAADDRPARGRAPARARGACSTPVAATGGVRLRRDVAGELPMQAICILLGVPEADRHQLFEWIEHVFDFRGAATRSRRPTTSRQPRARMFEYGAELIAREAARPGRRHALGRGARRRCPARIRRRSPTRSCSSSSACCSRPAPTRPATRSPAGCSRSSEHPEQLARRPRRDRAAAHRASKRSCAGRARGVQPPHRDRRRRARRSRRSPPGDKVVFWEASANRDEPVFADAVPVRRRRVIPNPHLGFGHGVHHCLGASLARLEIRVVLDEVLDRVRRRSSWPAPRTGPGATGCSGCAGSRSGSTPLRQAASRPTARSDRVDDTSRRVYCNTF